MADFFPFDEDPVTEPFHGYTTPTQVHALNKGRQMFTATSRDITFEDVEGFIYETAAVLNGILAERSYTIPVPTTAELAYGVLNHYNTLGAACMVEKAAPTSDRREQACEAWANAQEMLRSGAIQLPDAELSVTNDMPTGLSPATPMFFRDQEF